MMTWSPTENPFTSAPTSTMTPAASWPITAGNGTSLRFPSTAFKSLAHNPLAATFTRSSPDFGLSSSTSRTSNFEPMPSRTAAFIFTI